MERLVILVSLVYILTCIQYSSTEDLLQNKETILSATLIPTDNNEKLVRQSRSYYDYRYGIPRPYYDRLDYARYEYDRPRCGRCDDRYDRGRDDRDDDYDRRDRYDDDRRSNKPTSGNRYDNKKNYDRDGDEDRYSNKSNKNNTEEENGDNNRPYDDKDSRPSGSRRGSDRDKDRDSDRRRGGDRNRYDDRDRYRPDYYDRFLGDRNRDRGYDRDDYYRDRRPVYDRYYGGYDDGYGRYDSYGSPGYRRQVYDRGYDDGYGGYGPGIGRGPHESFRPWDETYRGQAGWDAVGRGYYFASGRPDAAPATGWGRPVYTRPQETGWQNLGYSNGYAGGYRDPYGSYGQASSSYGQSTGYSGAYAGSAAGYGQSNVGYGQSGVGYGSSGGYGQNSGWHSVGERRPYRDESGVKGLENREKYNQLYNQKQYPTNSQSSNYNQHGQSTNYGSYPQIFQSSSTTPGTSYLFQRQDEQVTVKLEDTTKNS